MRKARLENWQEVNLFGRTCIVGNVYDCEVTEDGERVFENGEEMFTSQIIEYHNMMGQTTVETKSGSMYHLGVPKSQEETLQEIVGRKVKESKGVN
jgi:hypothetical protein